MTLLIISIILTVLTAIIIPVGIKIYRNYQEYDREECRKSTYLTTFISLAWLIIILFGCFTKVGANEVGIVYDDRYGVLDDTIGEGFKFKSPFYHVTTISTSNRTAIVETTGQTNDGQYATFIISVVYRIDKENAGKFYKKTNSTDLSQTQLDTFIKQSLQSNTIRYDIFELLSEGLESARISFENTLREELLKNYYVTLVSTSFDDVDAGESIEKILQQKAEAEQRIEIAQKDAEANLITAENQAQVEKTLADAEAYAIITKGQANADNATAYVTNILAMIDNIQTNSGLTYEESADLVLSIIFYDTWDGKLPSTLTSDSLSSLIGSLIK